MRIGSYQFEWYKIPKVNSAKTITNSQVKMKFSCDSEFVSDSYFDLISKKDMEKVISLNRFTSKNYAYTKRVRDCDDYAFALMGMVRKLLPGVCFGITWIDVFKPDGSLSFKHAINFFIDSNKQLWFVEPQTNQVFSPLSKYKPFMMIV